MLYSENMEQRNSASAKHFAKTGRFKKRLSVDLPIELHTNLAYIARKRRCTISKWVTEKLELMATVEKVLGLYSGIKSDEK